MPGLASETYEASDTSPRMVTENKTVSYDNICSSGFELHQQCSMNNVHRMANLFASMQSSPNNTRYHHRQQAFGGNSGGYGDESDPSQQQRFRGGINDERNGCRPSSLRSRSTETSRRGSSSPSTTTTTSALYCCDLKVLDNKSKFSSAKALFESLERQSREQKRGFSSAAKLSPSSAVVVVSSSSLMFNEQKITTNRISPPSTSTTSSRNALIATETTSTMSSRSSSPPTAVVASSASSSASSSIIKHQQRSRLVADRGECPNINFNTSEPCLGKITPPTPPPVPPKPKIDANNCPSLIYSSYSVSSTSSTTTVSPSIRLNYASGGYFSSHECSKYVSPVSNSSSSCAKDLGSTRSSMKEFNDVEQISDERNSHLSTSSLSALSPLSRQKQHQIIITDCGSPPLSMTTTTETIVNSGTATTAASAEDQRQFYSANYHQSNDARTSTTSTTSTTTAAVVGASSNSLSKFLNSYSGCISPSASSSNSANIRKYPRLTQTLSMENNSGGKIVSTPVNDGSVVTLVGSPKPSVRTMNTKHTVSPKLDVSSPDKFCSSKLLTEKLNPANNSSVDCKSFNTENNIPTTATSSGYEPYWRQGSWYSRRYANSDNIASSPLSSTLPSTSTSTSSATSTKSVEGIAMRNYSLRRNETTPLNDVVCSGDNKSKLPRDVVIKPQSSSILNENLKSENDQLLISSFSADSSSGLVLNLTDNNSKLMMGGGNVDSSMLVDYMTREEASVLLSPATREEVLMHASLTIENPIVANSTPSTTDVKTLPSSYPIPQDVDLKRLSVCSIDSSTTTVTTNEHGLNVDRYSMHDVSDVHWLSDGHFWIEIPGLVDEISLSSSPQGSFRYKKPTKVTFSVNPIRVYSTYSGLDYDRRNDEVDPVSASAEYELERRLDKMDVFDVDVDKGTEGLGFSIIGMGVGADAGLEKLGIFVKSITPGGAVFRDGRIRICDQIVEVDGKSLVGVSQSYAASVLRATSGTVKFKIGREKDLDVSEIAQLIRQSLEQDRMSLTREKDLLSRRNLNAPSDMQESSQQLLPPPRPAGWGPVRDSPLPSTDSVFTHEDETPEQLVDNPHIEHLMTQLRKQNNVEISSKNDENEETDDGSVCVKDDDDDDDDDDDENYDSFSPNVCSSRSAILSQSFIRANFIKPRTAFQIDSSISVVANDSIPVSLNTDINRLLNDSLSDDKETHFPSNGADPETTAPSIVLPSTSANASSVATNLSRRKSPQDFDSSSNVENEFINRRIGSMEFTLVEIKQEADKYQNLLVESQEQYVDLEKKYTKAKKLIRDYQEREKDLLEREEAHLKHLREKDQHYSSLLKQLNDKVSELEKQLSDAQRKRASLAERTNSSSSNGTSAVVPVTDISPALAYLPSKKLENEQLQTSGHKTTIQIVPHSSNTAFVEEVDFGVPETQLLDNTFAKSKAEAVKQSVIMSARQLPSRHVDDEFFEACHRKVKQKCLSTDVAASVSLTSTTTTTTTMITSKLSPTKTLTTNTSASTSTGSPLTPRRLTQVLWMRKKTASANKELELSVMRGHSEFDKIPEVFQWSCDDVCKFLKTLGLEKYSPEFSINRVDGCKLMQLDGAKLKSMGIQNHTDRALIKKRVKDMKCQIDKERKLLGKEYKKFLKLEKDKKKT